MQDLICWDIPLNSYRTNQRTKDSNPFKIRVDPVAEPGSGSVAHPQVQMCCEESRRSLPQLSRVKRSLESWRRDDHEGTDGKSPEPLRVHVSMLKVALAQQNIDIFNSCFARYFNWSQSMRTLCDVRPDVASIASMVN